MPIVGHGIDLVHVPRIRAMLQEHADRFRARCFTPRELAAADATARHAEFLAGRFAAKEATLKALGTGWRHGIAWTDIEVVPDNQGRPTLQLTGQAARFAGSINVVRWSLSITHTADFAIASAIAEA
ncbi:MAG: holo-ACP synthase [Phycisphaerae bacterium]|nr:holo-ACP synthase [Phycisphaerae bacterium]